VGLLLNEQQRQHPDPDVEASEEAGDDQLYPRAPQPLTSLFNRAVKRVLLGTRRHIGLHTVRVAIAGTGSHPLTLWWALRRKGLVGNLP